MSKNYILNHGFMVFNFLLTLPFQRLIRHVSKVFNTGIAINKITDFGKQRKCFSVFVDENSTKITHNWIDIFLLYRCTCSTNSIAGSYLQNFFQNILSCPSDFASLQLLSFFYKILASLFHKSFSLSL